MTYLLEYTKKNGKTITLQIKDDDMFIDYMNVLTSRLKTGDILTLNVEVISL